MRQLILFLLFVTVFCRPHPASAQDNYYVQQQLAFYGGLVMGANFTQVDGDRFAGYNKVGLNAGGIGYVKFNEYMAVSIEILYSQKGSKSKDYAVLAPGLYVTNYGISLNYAEIPVMINFLDKRKSNFGIGISYSRLATSSEYITTSPPQYFNLEQFPFKKSDYNLLAGGNLHLWKGLFLNARFQYSLASVRDKIPQTYAKAAQYNNMWTIRLMYLFM